MKVIESTAKGVGNYFHRTWIDATEHRNNFTPVFIPWFTIDLYSKPLDKNEYDTFVESMDEYEQHLFELGATLEAIAWYRDKRREMPDEWRLFSEFPSTAAEAFQSSGRRVFRIPYVNNARQSCLPPTFIGDIKEGYENGKPTTRFEPLMPGERSDETMIAPTSAPHVPSIVAMPDPKPDPRRSNSSSLFPSQSANATSTAWQQFISLLRFAAYSIRSSSVIPSMLIPLLSFQGFNLYQSLGRSESTELAGGLQLV